MTKAMNQPLTSFPGFSHESLDFFRRLRKNNRREWFAKHRAEYGEGLLAPMKALVAAVEEECHKAGLPLIANRRSPVNRIYRDIRFSPDKSPYHTHIGALLSRDGSSKSPGVLYLHFSDTEAFVAAGFWQPEPELLQAWRTQITEKPGGFSGVVAQLKKNKLELTAAHSLRSMPRGYAHYAKSPLAPLLKLTSFTVIRKLTAKDLGSRSLPKTIAKFGVNASPLLQFGWTISAAAEKRRAQEKLFAAL